MNHFLRIRTITAFVNLCEKDFDNDDFMLTTVKTKIDACSRIVQELRDQLTGLFMVQTVRVALNPFAEWLLPHDYGCSGNHSEQELNQSSIQTIVQKRLDILEYALQTCDITFCSLGPATATQHVPFIQTILSHSQRFSCSIEIASPQDTHLCAQASATIIQISHQCGVDANFRFCVQASCQSTHIPFFPAATTRFTADNNNIQIGVAIGLENGSWFQQLIIRMQQQQHLTDGASNMMDELHSQLIKTLTPIQRIAEHYKPSPPLSYHFLGIDTSLNPSLDSGIHGSVVNTLDLLRQHLCSTSASAQTNSLIRPGTLAATALLTKTLQSLTELITTGYCGIMLPVCEDIGLATLDTLQIHHLLMISGVCGVGIDTVPLPGSVSLQDLTALILDVVGLAYRWKKPLTCRVFPCPGRAQGDLTQFNSPFLCNARILNL